MGTHRKSTSRSRAAGTATRRAVDARFPNRELLIDALRVRHGCGATLTPTLAAHEDAVLCAAVRRHFKSWRIALHAIGVEPDEYLRKRRPIDDPAVVIGWIRERHRMGQSLRQVDVQGPYSREFNAGVKLFGSWGLALADAGLDPREYVRSRKLHAAEQDVRDALRRMMLDGNGRLTKARVRDADWTLYSDARYWAARHAALPKGRAARWQHVLAWIGAHSDYHRARDTRRADGVLFERLAQAVWPMVDAGTVEHPRIKPLPESGRRYVEPDRARGRALFVEFRIAPTVRAVMGAIERYEGLCDRLQIVVLEGRYARPLPPWVEVRSIFEFEDLIVRGGGREEMAQLRALSRGDRPYVPERWSKDSLLSTLRKVPKEHRGDATAIRQHFFKTYGQTATKRLDKLRGTFAASCYAEGLISHPGPGKRPHIPKRHYAAVLYHFVRSRRALELSVDRADQFYGGNLEMKRMYRYAWLTYGGWPAMLEAVDCMAEPPFLPAAYNLAVGSVQ